MDRSDSERETTEGRPQSGYVIAGLAGAMLAVVLLATYARDSDRPQFSSAQDCADIKEGYARLNCYDEVLSRPAPEPAKGANAPLS